MTDSAGELLARTDARRVEVANSLPTKQRTKLGQFFTPAAVAEFLAELIDLPEAGTLRLLDPGAGVGSLSAAVLARIVREAPGSTLHVMAFEADEALAPHLEATLTDCVHVARDHGVSMTHEIRVQSFVEYATGWLLERPARFDACVMNPPYRKVSTTAPERVAAQSIGLRASNLYTIFVALAANLLDERGQLSAIIPRSFANGPYHEPFRRFLLDRISLDFVHVYDKRGDVFADADVLQENVIVGAHRGVQRASIVLSRSDGATHERSARPVASSEVVRPGDPHAFVRLPMFERDTLIADAVSGLPATLPNLDLAVSTGRVVDFRAREYLRQLPATDTVPLIYPGHLSAARVRWPTPESKKPNALACNRDTASLLLPNENYVLVKRFSAKEERRRVVAAVASPAELPGKFVAFENHLNVFHQRGRGLPHVLALGLDHMDRRSERSIGPVGM